MSPELTLLIGAVVYVLTMVVMARTLFPKTKS